jgi:polyvinyl alcohol dehydrogenase (cytochrome)
VPLVALATGSASWPSGGQNASNTHSQSAESKISPSNVQNLALKWAATTHGDVSAIPAVVDGAVYVPDWGPNYLDGYLNKFDADTGATIWSKPISDYTGVAHDAARAAPVVSGNTIYLGDQGAQAGFPGGFGTGGGYLFAVNATTGAPIWTTKVDNNPFAIITSGALLVQGVLYVGVASGEEAEAAFTSDPCCRFRGSIVAVDAKTGQILWKTYTVPENGGVGGGYSGGGVWGTTPAYDPQSKTVYATTGNNYSVPDSVKQCQASGGTASQCLDPNDHIDSILALDAATGQIKWATRLQEFDDWNVACIFGNPANCPRDPGPDFDFGSGPNLFTANGKLVVGAGQKSGIYFALDAKTGQVLWVNQAGPGSTLGGIEWGPATDGERIYVAQENFNGIPYAIPGGGTITAGSWAALDPATGNTLWQVADDSHNAFGGGNALGPVTVANGVVYAPSMSGKVRALDASTGATLWSRQLPGAAVSGAVVANGVVYWGNGYTHLGLPGWAGNNKLYAFSLNGK